jgi:hypothetical protein
MCFATVIFLLFVFPLASVAAEVFLSSSSVRLVPLVGRWFVFWAAGMRLFIAGVRQVAQPRFTAEEIFGIKEPKSLAIVQELGFANLSMGTLGILTIFRPDWVMAGAIVGVLYYALAGAGHLSQQHKNAKEKVAMISDAFAVVVLFAFMIGAIG